MRQGARDNLPPENIKTGGRYYMGKGAFVTPSPTHRLPYMRALMDCIEQTVVTGPVWDETLHLEEALGRFAGFLHEAHDRGGKVIFIGNGGSAAIASHMSVDYSKNKGIRAVAFNDAPMLTCLSNDFGYDQVFAKQIEWFAKKEDVAVIISSSGKSKNILEAVRAARECELDYVVTLSGMNPHNSLRTKGDLNFYVPCLDYGLVEIAHLSLLHSVAST
jgi:D-sedoheptulose 7-phosphate isomerase